MSHRPKFPKNDLNHNIVSQVLRALDYHYGGREWHLIDTSKVGGFLPDWLLIVDGLTIYVDVKAPTEKESLTEGQVSIKAWGVPFYIVSTKQEVVDMLGQISGGGFSSP